MAPCISVISREYEEKLFEIEFKPSKGVTDEDVALVHIDALKSKYFILKWEILKEYSRVKK